MKRCFSDDDGGGVDDELEDNDLLKNRRAQWLEVESKKVMKPLSRATQTPFFR